jgi:predicted Fe-Mo cluster-binding NifX family protein
VKVGRKKASNPLPDNIPAPARRALAGAGITRLEQLAKVSEAELLALHGMGPNAVATLRDALQAIGRSFRGGDRDA